jgi:FlaA1/EpsC-like NDP-sugar epimerase
LTARRLIIWLHDAAVTALALGVSFLLRWGGTDFAARLGPIATVCALTLPLALAAYWFFRLDRSPWKFVSLPDVNRIALAAAVPALFLVLVDWLSRGAIIVPRTVPVIYWLLQVALLAGPRILYRMHRSRRRERRAFRDAYRAPVLIAGTDDDADGLISRLRRDAVAALDPVGLLTAKPRHLGERIQQVPVLGAMAELESVLSSLEARGIRPRRIIVTRDAMASPEIDRLLGLARRLGVTPVRLSQRMLDIGSGDAPLELAPVSIDDLLGRSRRDLDLAPVRELVTGRQVAVTGAGGSIGSELCRQLAEMGAAGLLLIEQSEHALWSVTRELGSRHPGLPLVQHLGSVCDRAGLERAFARFRPDLVFHAAALKHVDIVEAHPIAASDTNTLGTEEVARAAGACGAGCAVFISTDKAVDPVSVLGATKRAGERIWAAADRGAREAGRPTRFVTVRFGNVLGSSGSVIPLFTRQLQSGGPITVTDPEVERYFMTIGEAVRLVLMASTLGVRAPESSPTFVLDMGEPVKIVDLARRMIRLAGLEPDTDIAIAFTGLRPGERLREVLEGRGEELRPTAIEGVQATDAGAPAADALARSVAALRAAVRAGDDGAALRVLAELVPEYGRPGEGPREAGPGARAPAARVGAG